MKSKIDIRKGIILILLLKESLSNILAYRLTDLSLKDKKNIILITSCSTDERLFFRKVNEILHKAFYYRYYFEYSIETLETLAELLSFREFRDNIFSDEIFRDNTSLISFDLCPFFKLLSAEMNSWWYPSLPSPFGVKEETLLIDCWKDKVIEMEGKVIVHLREDLLHSLRAQLGYGRLGIKSFYLEKVKAEIVNKACENADYRLGRI